MSNSTAESPSATLSLCVPRILILAKLVWWDDWVLCIPNIPVYPCWRNGFASITRLRYFALLAAFVLDEFLAYLMRKLAIKEDDAGESKPRNCAMYELTFVRATRSYCSFCRADGTWDKELWRPPVSTAISFFRFDPRAATARANVVLWRSSTSMQPTCWSHRLDRALGTDAHKVSNSKMNHFLLPLKTSRWLRRRDKKSILYCRRPGRWTDVRCNKLKVK